MTETGTRPPLPPFTAETAAQKIRMAELLALHKSQ